MLATIECYHRVYEVTSGELGLNLWHPLPCVSYPHYIFDHTVFPLLDTSVLFPWVKITC